MPKKELNLWGVVTPKEDGKFQAQVLGKLTTSTEAKVYAESADHDSKELAETWVHAELAKIENQIQLDTKKKKAY